MNKGKYVYEGGGGRGGSVREGKYMYEERGREYEGRGRECEGV